MSDYTANDAELSFFGTLQGEPLDKDAAELSPETLEGLNIPSVSPRVLDQLEAEAKGLIEPAPAPPEKSGPPPTEKPIPPRRPAPPTKPTEEPIPPRRPAPAAEAEAAPTEEPAEEVEVEQFSREDLPPEAPEPAAPELPSRATHGRLFSDKRAHPIQLLNVLTLRYKTDWAKWEPDTLWWALRRDFGPVGNVNRNKIGALRVAVTTDVPWLDWDVFEDSGLAWNDIVPVIGTMQPMTPMQVALTVQVLRAIRPDEEFGHEVKAYIAAVLDEHGFVYAPENFFANAQELLDRKQWLMGLKSDVESGWKLIKDIDPTEIEWNPEIPMDIHLLKLAVVHRYLAEREALREAAPGFAATSSTATPPVP